VRFRISRYAGGPRLLRSALLGLALVAAGAASPLGGSAAVAKAAAAEPIFFKGHPDSAQFRAQCEAQLKLAQEKLDRLVSVRGKRTSENTLVPYSLLTMHADNAASQASLMKSVHPDSAYRATAEGMSQVASKFLSDLSLNRAVYDALASVDLSAADPTTQYFVTKTLRDFRLAGVDKDEATRKQISALRDELVLISQEFDRNIRNDSRKIQVTAAELKGLPEDFMKAHPPGPDGKITVSIEYPDLFPVLTYAQNGDVRRRLRYEWKNRAYPDNMAVLDKLIAKRYELARLLGYPEWADYVTADKMIGTAQSVAQFIERLGTLTRAQADREYQVYLKRKQEDHPKATAVELWDSRYYERLIRERDYNFNAEVARDYFPFAAVKQGVLGVTSKIFGITYKRVANAAVWDPSVEAYEIWENGKMIGRFFLDLHPRPGKFNHAAQFPIRTGVAGVQIPEGALVCNFAGGVAGEPGLMEHDDVTTFFHEFGHLLHAIFGGDQRWAPVSGYTMEWDFVEAPSQMLEEWCWDPAVLQTFAKNYKTGEPIPVEMVKNMTKADTFGRAIDKSHWVCFSAISLGIYDRNPKEVNTDAVVRKSELAFVPFPPMPDTHMQASFGHLDGYSATYYTYLWSLVIAKDLFSQFDRSNLLDPTVPARYRAQVLAPGGSKPAAQLVRDFLNRDFNYVAFENYLKGVDYPVAATKTQ